MCKPTSTPEPCERHCPVSNESTLQLLLDKLLYVLASEGDCGNASQLSIRYEWLGRLLIDQL
jgi:hypothetical protein